MTVAAARHARSANVAHAVIQAHVRPVSCVKMVPASLVVAITWTALPINHASTASVSIRACNLTRAAKMHCARCPNIACYACAPMAIRVNRRKDAVHTNADVTTIVKWTNAVMLAVVAIHASRMVYAASMLSAVWPIDVPNARVHLATMEIRWLTAYREHRAPMDHAMPIHAVAIHGVETFLAALNAAVLLAASAIHATDASAAIIM